MPVAVVTGCSSGLGALVLRQLLHRLDPTSLPHLSHWTILAGTRSSARPALPSSSTVDVEWIPLDLARVDSVRQFAETVKLRLADLPGPPHVDVVLLNAATWNEHVKTVDVGEGESYAEEAFVNHFAQYHLVQLLEPLLARPEPSTRSRIIVTTSSLQNSVKSLDDLPNLLRPNASSSSTGKSRYAASKLAQTIAFHHLKRRWSDSGTPVEIVTVSPGFVPTTNLSRDSPWWARWLMRNVVYWLPFCSTEEKGAARILSCFPFLQPRLERNDDEPLRDDPTPADPSCSSTRPSRTFEEIVSASLDGRSMIPYQLDPELGERGARTPHPELRQLFHDEQEGRSDEAVRRWKELGGLVAPPLSETSKW
ncbi:hypothetical protein JCM10212_000046 [Sporobolomyces blumeae]